MNFVVTEIITEMAFFVKTITLAKQGLGRTSSSPKDDNNPAPYARSSLF